MRSDEVLQGPPPSAKIVAGMIEAMGSLGDRAIFVNGWSREHPAPRSAVAVVTAERLLAGKFSVIWSDRPDVGAGNGFCGIVALEESLDPARCLGLRLASGRMLVPYERLATPDATQAGAFLREALGKAADAPARSVLEPFAHRYDGTDTVANSALPVRVGVDECVLLDGGHLLVRGWIFDPERLVEAVALAGAGAKDRRIDRDWVGQLRPDVTRSFAADPRFGGYGPPHDAHGFSAIVAPPVTSEDLHLSLTGAGLPLLRIPLTIRTGNTAVLLRQFVAALDPEAAGTLDILEHQIVPALTSAGERPRGAGVTARAANDEATALVLGCSGNCADATSWLQIIAVNMALRDLMVVIAADARELSVHAGDLRRQAESLGLRLSLVFAEAVFDEVDALLAGGAATLTSRVLLLAGSHLPSIAGDLAPMLDAAPEDRPTLLHPGGAIAVPRGLLISSGALADATAGLPMRLSAAGKWDALGTRLIGQGPAPARAAITGSPVVEDTPSDRLLRHVDACAAAATRDR